MMLLGACSDGDVGGEANLPRPVPTGVSFVASPAAAATAPEFSGELVDGTPFEAATLWADRPLVLLFTAPWCGRCADQHREVAAAVDEYDGAIALLGLVDDVDEDPAAYAEEVGVAHPLGLVPTDVWNSYAAEEPPLVVLVGPGGVLLRGWPGGVDQETLTEELGTLIAEGDTSG
jgi:thiol-disulfide isomerase/thioredoxin